ncbi:MAG: hypothetical protein KAR35_07980 [Candidatus Heimdallarchaeota archaeon]|nr:hypothetical protein [Candidatus Heimdallarchaeota archaeon]MCK5049297.1 hypothetical protein [Candidatus Heimdallarchaeota archaeon]
MKESKKIPTNQATSELGTYLNTNDLSKILQRTIRSSSSTRSFARHNTIKFSRWLEWLDELLGQFYYYFPPSMIEELRAEAKPLMKKILKEDKGKNFTKRDLFRVLCAFVIFHHKNRHIRTPRNALQELSENCFSAKKLKPNELLDAKKLISDFGRGKVGIRKNTSLRSAIISSALNLRMILSEELQLNLDETYKEMNELISEKIFPKQEPVKGALIILGKLISQNTSMTVQDYVKKLVNSKKLAENYPLVKLEEKNLATAIYRFKIIKTK